MAQLHAQQREAYAVQFGSIHREAEWEARRHIVEAFKDLRLGDLTTVGEVALPGPTDKYAGVKWDDTAKSPNPYRLAQSRQHSYNHFLLDAGAEGPSPRAADAAVYVGDPLYVDGPDGPVEVSVASTPSHVGFEFVDPSLALAGGESSLGSGEASLPSVPSRSPIKSKDSVTPARPVSTGAPPPSARRPVSSRDSGAVTTSAIAKSSTTSDTPTASPAHGTQAVTPGDTAQGSTQSLQPSALGLGCAITSVTSLIDSLKQVSPSRPGITAGSSQSETSVIDGVPSPARGEDASPPKKTGFGQKAQEMLQSGRAIVAFGTTDIVTLGQHVRFPARVF